MLNIHRCHCRKVALQRKKPFCFSYQQQTAHNLHLDCDVMFAELQLKTDEHSYSLFSKTKNIAIALYMK